MNIMILTAGSRGDVQPFVALGRGLTAAGHTVTLAGPRQFDSFVTSNGLAFSPVNDDLLRLKDTASGQQAMEGGGKLALIKQVMPMLRKMLHDASDAAAEIRPDAIVYHPKALAGIHLAEKYGIPGYLTLPLPLTAPTREFPVPIVTGSFGGFLNRLSYGAAFRAIVMPYMGMINTWRAETLGLRKLSRLHSMTHTSDGTPANQLLAFSTHVVPRPADWPDHICVTGYWTLDDARPWQPSEELERFLDSGPAPVYVGFGSMVGTDAAGTAQTVIDALKKAGQRGVIASGWGGLRADSAPAHIHIIDEAPHDKLFPLMSAVVHHGGSGTTAAGLTAGKPTVVVPFTADQPFWGARVHALGAGPAPISKRRLTVDALAAAIDQAVNSPDMRATAERIGAALRAEDGVAKAVEVIAG
ncbi:MAG: glycosyltransferase family 1 protein [Chloroflexi bacterium]|nr:glycosyltransferase family 1 protein [Chloroflexota bacterium]